MPYKSSEKCVSFWFTYLVSNFCYFLCDNKCFFSCGTVMWEGSEGFFWMGDDLRLPFDYLGLTNKKINRSFDRCFLLIVLRRVDRFTNINYMMHSPLGFPICSLILSIEIFGSCWLCIFVSESFYLWSLPSHIEISHQIKTTIQFNFKLPLGHLSSESRPSKSCTKKPFFLSI